jgi:hypothetical protein
MHLLQLLDAGLVWAAFLAAANVNEGPPSMRSWMLYVVVPFTPLVLEFLKFYAPDRPAAAFQVLGRLATALLFTVGVVVLLVLSVAASEGSAPFRPRPAVRGSEGEVAAKESPPDPLKEAESPRSLGLPWGDSSFSIKTLS